MALVPVGPTSGANPYLINMTPGLQNQLLSSPFIRWLLENQRMLNAEGTFNRFATILQGMLEQGAQAGLATPSPTGTPALATTTMAGAPGISMEQASADYFRNLTKQLQTMLANARRLQPYMLPPEIRDRVWPPETRMIPPSPMVPGKPY
ncbi:hypothetical protein OO015_00585 [Thermomicrobium sp. 4228-Ro]|uniref:hypothetical protein n=1 Tax=Thermomicrobium sp. 4228-Ro TaxID=2993937 RepID=UPI00224959C7|nr:hypothetical protein [Thermomicrobium sp. 4228-Ro]MCX2726004.1 hypothetical protein [Thermomicrobium sp. 4228-Ro]